MQKVIIQKSKQLLVKLKFKWKHNSRRIYQCFTKIVTVSHRIGQRPWRSSCQQTPSIIYRQVL